MTENIFVDRLDTFVPHPIKGAFDLSCTVVWFLSILLWNQLVHLLEITCWIKGLVHGVAQPRRNVIDVLLPFFGTSRDLGKGTIQTRLENDDEAACKFFCWIMGIILAISQTYHNVINIIQSTFLTEFRNWKRAQLIV